MHFVDRLFEAIRRAGTRSASGSTHGPRNCRRASSTGSPRTATALPRHSTASAATSSTSSPPRPRGQVSVRFLRSLRPAGRRRPARVRRLRPRQGPDRHRRRQTQRHRLDRRSLRTRLSGQGPRRRRVEPSWQADAITVNPYLGTDGVAAVRQGRRPRTQGRLRPGPDQQHSAGEFQDLVADGKPLYRHVADRVCNGPRHIAANAVTASSGRSSGRPTPGNSPSCARPCRESLCSFPATAPRGHRPRRRRRIRSTASAPSSIIRAGSPSPTSAPAYRTRFGDDWQAAVEQAVRDMIDDLAANTTAGRLRQIAPAGH